jgi:FkbM family methyltransferase
VGWLMIKSLHNPAFLCKEDCRLFDKAIDRLDFAARVYMRLQGMVLPTRIVETFFGAKMYCNIKDFIQRRIYYFGIFEPNLSNYIVKNIHNGDYVIDVGANIGYMTLLLASSVGASGRVVAIEASPANYRALIKNIKLNKCNNIAAINMAATSGPCSVEIVGGDKNNSGTLSIRESVSNMAETVKGDALSNVSEICLDKVTFIKIDVEGSEAAIIKNIIETIHLYKSLKSIAAELTPASSHLLAELQNNGFQAYAFPNNYRIGYLMVRKYLQNSHEDGFVVKIPVEAYDAKYRDYMFERLV